jgi:hypothetical protein
MKTYKTYQEAKIANPDSEIYYTKIANGGNGAVFGLFYELNKFTDTIHKCDPADYCTPLDEFLSSGRKLVEGDLFIGVDGSVFTVKRAFNVPAKISIGRYILRAAALEQKPKRTKVEFVKVELKSNFEHLKRMIDGERFYNFNGEIEYSFNGAKFVGKTNKNKILDASWTSKIPVEIYLRIETEITERDEFIAQYVALRNEFAKQNTTEDFCEYMADSGKFKLADGE